MMNTKRRGNVPPQNDSEERESLMSGGGIEMTSKRTPTRSTLRSGNTSPHRREKRKTSGVMDKDDEERVSLIGGGGGGGGGRRPQGGRRPLRIADTRRRTVFNMFSVPKFSMNTIMRYIGLMLASATVSFMLFHRQPRTVHWGQYNKVLEPAVGRGTRCFEEHKGTSDTPCTCPDPTKAIENSSAPLWISHHKSMVHRAQNAPKKDEKTGDGGLDIVFIGDDVIEQLSGSKDLGGKDAEGMEEYFEKRFTTNGGGKLEGLALGSTGDIGPNLLWHLNNGIIDAKLQPKVWFILVGGNDLFNSQCDDRFVVANTLNVVKTLYNSQPNAEFIIHGILPRVDNPDGKTGKTGALGNYWKRAQDINLHIKRFTRKGARLHYINGGPKFTKDHGNGIKGRKFIDLNLMTNGITPTTEGMKAWGDFIEKKVQEILHPKKRLFKIRAKDEGENRRNI